MPDKTNIKKEIKCRCGRDTMVDVTPATAYVETTRFMCDCGETFHIHDYCHGITTYIAVTPEIDDEYLNMEEEVKKRMKIMNQDPEGRKKYQIVERWLDSLTVEEVAGVEAQRTFHQTIDREFVIETILEHCRHEDDLLDGLFDKAIKLSKSIKFHASGDQCFTTKLDWYIIDVIDITDGKLSRPYASKAETKTVIDKLGEDPNNYDASFAVFSVPKGTKVTL